MTIPNLPSDGANPWGTSMRQWANAMKTALAGKSEVSHTHTIGHVNLLESRLAALSAIDHKHPIGDITGLSAELLNKATLPNPLNNNDTWLGVTANNWALKELPTAKSTALTLRGGVGGSLRYIKVDNIVVVYGCVTTVAPNYEFTIAIVPHKPLVHSAMAVATVPSHVAYTVRNSAGNGSVSLPVPIGASVRIWDNGNIDVRTNTALTSLYISGAYAIA